MSGERLLLCRPQGGLNDTLCQIENVCRYADRFDRTVIVETDWSRSWTFRDKFSKYFISRQPRLVLDAGAGRQSLYDLEVFPREVQGRIHDYAFDFDLKLGLLDTETGCRLSFDFDRDYAEPLLLHHAFGGGEMSLEALARLRLHDALGDVLVRRVAAIGPSYVGLHIRHTDYRTPYHQALAALARDIAGPVFVASDNRQAVADCREAFGAERVYAFAALPEEAGRPTHFNIAPESVYRANGDAILDLLTLALADRVYGFKLEENRYGTVYSGYTLLAMNLHNSKPVLSSLLSRSDPVLDHRLGLPGDKAVPAASRRAVTSPLPGPPVR